jgi:hypothetical protein
MRRKERQEEGEGDNKMAREEKLEGKLLCCPAPRVQCGPYITAPLPQQGVQLPSNASLSAEERNHSPA